MKVGVERVCVGKIVRLWTTREWMRNKDEWEVRE